MTDIAARLTAAGLSPSAAPAKAALFDAALRVLRPGPLRRYYVPGRVEFLGKHTDYAGGRSLLCAVERGVCAVAAPRDDAAVRVTLVDGEATTFPLAPDLGPPVGHWSNYPMTVARRVARNFPDTLRGVDIALASDLPRDAGLSSSGALVIVVFAALSDANGLTDHRAYRAEIHRAEDLAGYLGAVENGRSFGSLAGDTGVGTLGGSEDHTAILCCRSGEIAQYRFLPVEPERRLPFPAGYVLAIGVCGIAAPKTGAALEHYNRLARTTAAILDAWRAATSRNDVSLFAALTSAPDAPERLRSLARTGSAEFPPDVLRGRLEQFAAESLEIIPAAGDALARGDTAALGVLVDRSQQLAEQYLGNQIAETIALVRSARELGAVAASAFGAGFGGSVWALIPSRDAEPFLAAWRTRYARAFPTAALRSEFFVSGAGPGLMRP